MRGYNQMIRELMDKPFKKKYTLLGQLAVAKPAFQASNKPPLFTAGGIPIQPPPPPHALIYNDKDPSYNPHFEDVQEMPCKILFELNGWQIEAYEHTPKAEVDWISHYCPSEKWRFPIDQWQIMLDGVCPACCETIPDSIMGVWKLKNFDRLPATETSKVMNSVRIFKTTTDEDEELRREARDMLGGVT